LLNLKAKAERVSPRVLAGFRDSAKPCPRLAEHL
jgi:hypothetical protein